MSDPSKVPQASVHQVHQSLHAWVGENTRAIRKLAINARTSAFDAELDAKLAAELAAELAKKPGIKPSARLLKLRSKSKSASAVDGDGGGGGGIESQEDLLEKLKEFLNTDKAAFMCGGGVSRSLNQKCPLWEGLVTELGRAAQAARGLNDLWFQRKIEGKHVDEAAANIQRIMELNAGPADYRSLIYRVFHRMPVEADALAITLSKFGRTPLLTVNYDTLLEDALPAVVPGRGPACPGVWRFPMSHINVLDEGRLGSIWGMGNHGQTHTLSQLSVTHLHGLYWNRTGADGFTLTPKEYNKKIAIKRFLQFLLPGITGMHGRTRSLVFVGCNGTVQDVHFWTLWAAQRALRDAAYFEPLAQPEPEHFWLVSTKGMESAKKTVENVYFRTGVVIHVLCYGAHDDLPAFIDRLAAV